MYVPQEIKNEATDRAMKKWKLMKILPKVLPLAHISESVQCYNSVDIFRPHYHCCPYLLNYSGLWLIWDSGIWGGAQKSASFFLKPAIELQWEESRR